MGWDVWVVLAASAVALRLFTIGMRREWRALEPYAAMLGVDLVVLCVVHAQHRDESLVGAVATLVGLALLLGPRLAERWERQALMSERMKQALRAAQLRELLEPGRASSWRRRQLQNLVQAREGDVATVLTRLRAQIAKAPTPPLAALLHEETAAVYFLARRWSDGVAEAERHLSPEWLALHPLFAVQLLRAYGETGRLERALVVLALMERGPAANDPSAGALLTQARLSVLAFAGRVDDVERLLAADAGNLTPPKAQTWLRETARTHAAATSTSTARPSESATTTATSESSTTTATSQPATTTATAESAMTTATSESSTTTATSQPATTTATSESAMTTATSQPATTTATSESAMTPATSESTGATSKSAAPTSPSAPAMSANESTAVGSIATTDSPTPASETVVPAATATTDSSTASHANDSPSQAALARALADIAERTAVIARIVTQPRRRPLVTRALIAVNVAAAVAVVARYGFDAQAVDLVRAGALFRPAVQAGETWRAFIAMFLHDEPLHLALNMYVLLLLGRFTEELLGPLRFFVVYIVGGLCGWLGSTYAWQQPGLSLGASGAIMGLLGAIIVVLILRRGSWNEQARRSLLWTMVAVGVLQIYAGLQVPVIDNAAHVAGLAGGALATWILTPGGLLGGTGRISRLLAWLLTVASLIGCGWSAVELARTPVSATLERLPTQTVVVGAHHLIVPAYWEYDHTRQVVSDPYLGIEWDATKVALSNPKDPRLVGIIEQIAKRSRESYKEGP